jgi:sulfite reductase (NADPH) flavoprotein alpha-component
MSTAVLTTVPVLPDSAPFTPAQRAWLNGFFAGIFGGQIASAQNGAMSTEMSVEASPAMEEPVEETMDWHDPALPMDERLKLAEGKPRERVLMAAMAQLDCGACGYLCQTYAEAIARGEEKDLSRCAPGGKDTAKKLKSLMALPVATSVPAAAPAKRETPAKSESAYDRSNPFPARLLANKALNKPGSAKDTRLIALDLKGSGLTYTVGDALGIYPENCPESVNWLLERLNASGAEEVSGTDGSPITLFEALLKRYQITTPTESLVELMANHCSGPTHKDELTAMLDENGPGIPDAHEIIDLFAMYPTTKPPIREFITALRPLQPRLYSIASSLKAHPDEVHLTVGVVRYVNGRQRQCKGVASTYLSDRLRQGQKARVFVQQSHGFRVPFDLTTPMIMIGPGTGIAPFRAFLQERKATSAAGKNWLFFGDQSGQYDFLYQNELEAYQQDGMLHRLDTAFSRDQAEKIYVQHRMLQQGPELWQWLQKGAHVYVCGDAKRMASDVDTALRQIVAKEGGMSEENAKAFMTDLAKSKRYQRDVY